MTPTPLLALQLLVPPTLDPTAQYRLTTEFQGQCKSLDIVNDASDDKPRLAKTGELSGQLWKLTPVPGYWYRLSTQFQGPGKSLGIIDNASKNQPILAPTADVWRQHWVLSYLGDDYWRITTRADGPGKSLDIVNDAKDDTPILATTAVVSGQRWRLVKVRDVVAPPAAAKLDPFYKRYLDVDGIPVVSSANVDAAAHHRVEHTMRQLLSRITVARQAMVARKMKVALMAKTEKTRDMPEYANFGPFHDGRDVNTVRGYSASMAIRTQLVGVENVVCDPSDPYAGEDIFVHEFAHGIHRLGLEPAFGKVFTDELAAAYANAKANHLWDNTYAIETIDEYFAEGVQTWFNLNQAGPVGGDGVHNQVNTRGELLTYDPKLHTLLSKYFPADTNNCSCTPAH